MTTEDGKKLLILVSTSGETRRLVSLSVLDGSAASNSDVAFELIRHFNKKNLVTSFLHSSLIRGHTHVLRRLPNTAYISQFLV